MAASLYEAIADGGSRTVQQRGVLTLPKQWREKHELEQGDLVAVIENDDGHLEVIPPETDSPTLRRDSSASHSTKLYEVAELSASSKLPALTRDRPRPRSRTGGG